MLSHPTRSAHKPQNGCSWPWSIRPSLMFWRMAKRQRKQSVGYSARISMPWTDCSSFPLSHYKKGISETANSDCRGKSGLCPGGS